MRDLLRVVLGVSIMVALVSGLYFMPHGVWVALTMTVAVIVFGFVGWLIGHLVLKTISNF